MMEFLADLNLPSLSPKEAMALGAPITLEELTRAVESMKLGKSPGLDMHPELFQEVWDQVGSLILASINYAVGHGTFQRDQNAYI